MLNYLPRKNDWVFGCGNIKGFGATFLKIRKRLAYKLQNPRLSGISFKTFRHWKATMEYYKTKDILYVMRFFGHRKIDNTMIYINLENASFQATNEEFNVKVAKTLEEIKALLEVGFEYICEKDGLLFLRKRK
jgi:integrase